MSVLRTCLITSSEGQEIRVKVLDVDQRGRIKLSIKELLEDEAVADRKWLRKNQPQLKSAD